MGRLGRATLLVFTFGGAAAACSLFTSFDGYTGGPGPLRDGSDELADVIGADASSGETGADADAGTAMPFDAGPLPDGYCADASLCDDFERADLLGPWEKAVSVVSTVTIDTARAHSYGHSLRAEIAPYTGAGAALSKSFPSVSTLHAKLFLFLSTDTLSRAYEMIELRFSYANHMTSVGILANSGQLVFGEQAFPTDGGSAVYQNVIATQDLIKDRWFEVDFVVDVAAVPPTVTVKSDGSTLANKLSLKYEYGRAPGEVFAGVTFVQGGSPDTAIDIDDVRLDVVP